MARNRRRTNRRAEPGAPAFRGLGRPVTSEPERSEQVAFAEQAHEEPRADLARRQPAHRPAVPVHRQHPVDQEGRYRLDRVGQDVENLLALFPVLVAPLRLLAVASLA